MSTLMFWNKQNGTNNQNSDSKNGTKKNWLHAPDALLNGHVVYLVKFLGNTPVEQPKGIEVVKEAIRRLQFAQQMKKAETGQQQKLKKIEITISVDGVAIQEPRTQKILHQYPLHNISYCADEKGVKKFFTFIAKNVKPEESVNGITNGHSNGSLNNSNTTDDTHECFVFVSSKLASDITLTIGQAFDLAYRRYMNESGKTSELGKIQQQNKYLEKTVTAYKQRLRELSEVIPKSNLEKILNKLSINDLYELPVNENEEIQMNGKKSVSESSNDDKLLIETTNNNNNINNNNNNNNNKNAFVPSVPPRNLQNQINNKLDAFKPNQKMDELLLNSDSDSDFDPRAEESDTGNKITNDLFGIEPSKSFGQQLFTNNSNSNNIINNNNNNLTNNLNNNNNFAPSSISPPPLLAPPPKAAAPRRSNNNGVMNGGNQDLFGSAPFNPNTPSIFDQQLPSLQLNNSAFGDDPLTSNLSSSNNSVCSIGANAIQNPFNNETGFNESFNEGQRLNSNVLTDMNAFANNSSKLNGVLSNVLNQNSDNNFNLSSKDFTADFSSNQVGSEFSSLSATPNSIGNNPFMKKAESFLSPRISGSNYDALRNSPDLDAMDMTPPNSTSVFASLNPTISNPIQIKNANNPMNKDKSPMNSYDIFRDAANQIFNELSPGNSFNSNKHANEFSNKMAGFSVGYKEKSNFISNQKLVIDDFSLESLDPLRK